MKAINTIIALFSLFFAIAGCGTVRQFDTTNGSNLLKHASLTNKPDLSKYKYVYISPTSEKTSVTGDTYGNQYGVYGSTVSQSVVPSEVIAGVFMKHGFVRVPEINEAQKGQTIVVNYGESGRKNYFLAYSIEVTIQLLNAETYELICSATAEGIGETEADDVRKATTKCLEAIFE